MYGTIAKVHMSPDNIPALQSLSQSMGVAPGQLGRYAYQMDADPHELWLVAVFDSKEAYWANAHDPDQHQRFVQVRALFDGDPEWHDGEIIDAAMPGGNVAIVRRVYEEIINQEDKAVIAEVYAPDVIVHDPFTGTTHGVDAFRQLLGIFDTAFPHHRVRIDEVVSQGEWVSLLHTHTATHTGPFMGMPPTGKTVVVNGVELFRLRGGKIVEFWRKDDDVSLLMQLGMLPAPQAA